MMAFYGVKRVRDHNDFLIYDDRLIKKFKGFFYFVQFAFRFLGAHKLDFDMGAQDALNRHLMHNNSKL